jgi:hypothetical protein
MKRFKEQTIQWQQLIQACQLAPYSKISNIIFKNGNPITIGHIEERVLLNKHNNTAKPLPDDYELKAQWIHFIAYAKKRGDFSIDVLSVQDGLPSLVETKRPDINRMFTQVK